MKHLKSLREYIEALKEIGEVQEIDQEVDWNLEIGAITRRCNETGSPAPLFNRIKGIEPGFRVLGAPAGISRQRGRELCRVALSLGLSPEATAQQIVEAMADAVERLPLSPRIVLSGPCKENILLGDDVDLLRLPTPLIHAGDGGRFLNTWGTIVAQSPDGKWTNWNIARIMLHDRNTMVGIVSPQKHIGKLHGMWKEVGRPMPFALSLGQDPVVPFGSGIPLPDFVDEGGYLGALLGETIDVVKAETVDLYVPASSEIVIEGHLSLEEKASEGPMGEYPGYLFPKSGAPKPVYHVTAMTFRNDPILPIVAAGHPPEENHTCWGIGIAATVLAELRRARFPVTMCWVPFEGACHLMVVSVDSHYKEWSNHKTNADFVRELGEFIFRTRGGTVTPRILVIRDDVDATDIKDVVWAWATRCHPREGELLFPHLSTNPLGAFLRTDEKSAMITTKAAYDCLPQDIWTPENAPVRASFEYVYPKELQEKVLANWTVGYGYHA